MGPEIYKVINIEKGTLSIMAKPVSGQWIDDEFSGLKKLGVDKIISLLEYDEAYDAGLSQEQKLCSENDIEFDSFPIPDRSIPDIDTTRRFVKLLYQDIQSGKHIVIHCRAGIGRTGIIAGAILKEAGFDTKETIEKISEARGVQIPDTQEQEMWLNDY